MNRIKELRKARALRQADVARETCIDQKTLSNYELGRTSPDSYSVTQLSDFFGVTSDYLLGLSDYNFKDVDSIVKEIEEIEGRLATIKKILLSEKTDA